MISKKLLICIILLFPVIVNATEATYSIKRAPADNLKIACSGKEDDFYILAKNQASSDKPIPTTQIQQRKITKATVEKIKTLLEKQILVSSKNINKKHLHSKIASLKSSKHTHHFKHQLAFHHKKHIHVMACAKKIKHKTSFHRLF